MNTKPHPVALAKSYLLLNHGPVVLVSSASRGRSNVMSASWSMPLDFDPAKVVLVIDKQTFTRELVDAAGEFALSIPCRAIADKVLAAGTLCGRDGDKFARTGLETFAASRIDAPLIKDCVAWLECQLIPEPENQRRYDLFVAEVVAAWADPEVFSDGRWHFPDAQRTTIHYQAGGSFFETGQAFDCPEPSQ
jgi:flavin reductase (DIM6/NTAB) family NADH-FMN oxidoreductase RutF